MSDPGATPAGAALPRLAQSPLGDEVEFLLARARSVGIVRANTYLSEFDLKVRHYSVLALAASGLQPSQRELAEYLGLDPSQIVALVDGLERRGLVAREPAPHDRRLKAIVATADGAALYGRARAATERAERESLAGLEPGERETLLHLLRKIAFG